MPYRLATHTINDCTTTFQGVNATGETVDLAVHDQHTDCAHQSSCCSSDCGNRRQDVQQPMSIPHRWGRTVLPLRRSVYQTRVMI